MEFYYQAFNSDRVWSKKAHDKNHYKKMPLDKVNEVFRKKIKDLPVLIYLTIDTVIIDVDPRNGGLDSLITLSDSIGLDLTDCKKCPILKTGRGGFHIFFTNPKKAEFISSHRDFKGIDILSKGSRSIAPGSQFNPTIYASDMAKYADDVTKSWDGLYTMLDGSISIEDAKEIPQKIVNIFKKPEKTENQNQAKKEHSKLLMLCLF
jgi:hypothetical protein